MLNFEKGDKNNKKYKNQFEISYSKNEMSININKNEVIVRADSFWVYIIILKVVYL